VATELKDLLPELPDDNSGESFFKQPPIDAVDRIADALVSEYHNPEWRRWYCAVIYEFGPVRVYEWQQRAREGKWPAKLFSKYVKEARTYRGFRSAQDAK
jgi:hypothetical protein